MKVFISWSGDHSKAVATMLRKYLPTILQDVEPFVSAHDIESGSRWAGRLSDELKSTSYGILCLTSANLAAPWILFEAGALSKLTDSSLTGLLIGGLRPADISGPLSQFQHREFERDQVKKLIQDISQCCTKPLAPEQFELLFETFWPKIESEFNSIADALGRSDSTASRRTERDMIEEILVRLRKLDRQDAISTVRIPIAVDDLLDAPLSDETLRIYTETKFPGLGVSEHWQMALLRDIDMTRYPTIRHLDEAVRKAHSAVFAYQREQPHFFKTGTDFVTKSIGFVDADFRGRHNFAPTTLAAFNRHEKLVRL